MNYLSKLFYRYYHWKVMRKVRAICTHMLFVYNYLHDTNPHDHSGSYIREAVGLMQDWEGVSEHIYKHRPTAHAIEIGKYDELAFFTLKISLIEVSHLVRSNDQLMVRLIKADVEEFVKDYFKHHQPKGTN